MKTPNSPLKIALWFVVLLVGYLIARSMIEAGREQSSLDVNLTMSAKEISKHLPMMLDVGTRMDKVVPSSGKLTFYLTKPNATKDNLDLAGLKHDIFRQLVANYKTNSAKAVLRQHDVILDYQYKDKSGDLLFEISVSSKDF